MAIFASINDILEYEPEVLNYGIPSFDDALIKASQDVDRFLRINWWPTVGKYDITYVGNNVTFEPELLDAAQLARATVYCALGYYIFPRLSKFEPNLDVFQIKYDYYKKMYAEEIDLVIRDGVAYDYNRDGSFNEAEKEQTYFLRLQR
jgi:hypothetical protein